MSEAAVADLGLERLARIEERIGTAEEGGLRARWEFGHELLAARDGKGRLPNGYLRAITERTGVDRGELQRRVRFAERFPTEDELCHAMTQFGSWFKVVNVALSPAADVTDVTDVTAVPEGQFTTIVADPPWEYGNTSTRGAARDHYRTLSIAQLCGDDLLPDGTSLTKDVVLPKAAAAGHLYLWTTAGHLPEAFRVMQAWEFTYKTYLVWVKPQMGMGNYFRVSTELVLFGVRAGMRTRDMGIMNWFEARRGKHSAKPAAFYDLVSKASPGPYLEMFARCDRANQLPGTCQCSRCLRGWGVWGNQA